METQFASRELIEQRVGVEAGFLGNLPHPFGPTFELRQARFSLSELILPGRTGLSVGRPDRRLVFDGSKLDDLVMKGGLEGRLKDVDLLGFGDNCRGCAWLQRINTSGCKPSLEHYPIRKRQAN